MRATDKNFGIHQVFKVMINNTITGDTSGNFQLVVNGGERTVPLSYEASVREIKKSLTSLKSFGEISISEVISSTRTKVWLITFLQDIGDSNIIEIDCTGIKSIDGVGIINCYTDKIVSGSTPSKYG